MSTANSFHTLLT